MSGPDRTAKIIRALREVDGRSSARLIWPPPPYYEYQGEPPQAGEPALLTFTDGGKATGLVQAFLPEHEILKFLPENGHSAVTIAFSSLLTVQLIEPVRIEAHTLPDGVNLLTPSDRQPFSVTLADSSVLEGETAGHVQAMCGLFLFVPHSGRGVLRWFLPSHAVRASRIGKPIGELLIEEQAASAENVSEALEHQKQLRSRRLGEYLTAYQIVSPEQLAAALKAQRAQPAQKLGETLVELGFLTQAELEEALAIEARDRSVPLGQILADTGVVDIEIVHSVMAKKLGIPVVDLGKFRPAPEALKRLPAAMANRYRVVPLAEAENGLVIAIDDPIRIERLEEVRFVAGTKLIPVVARASDIRQALESAYGQPADADITARWPVQENIDISELTLRLSSESADEDSQEAQAPATDSTLVRLVNKMILDAFEQKASDIHIEVNPTGRMVRVRLRKDGALVNYLEIPARFRSAVVSRLKVMSQLDISERRKPQEGKISFRRYGPLDVELRITTIPTSNGLEDVVIRVLAAATPKPIDEIGFEPEEVATLRRLISRPHGLFLVCGPTGSGKTTTLHSLLAHLNTSEVKIWTAEDPIEIVQAGLRQVQMNAKIGWSFAAAMKSFMRADPDVIMVGEMRDAETTKIVIEASLTGHLVLSTLHTNSAPESVVRLLDLGMDPFNFADALLGVLAQRLVRRLCMQCRVKREPSARELEELAAEYCEGTALEPAAVLDRWRLEKPSLYQPKGCKDCDRTGYKGRLAIYELMVADATVKRLIQTRAPVSEISAAALANGMRTLKQDGINKVLRGFTDMREVRAV